MIDANRAAYVWWMAVRIAVLGQYRGGPLLTVLRGKPWDDTQ